MTPRTPFRLLAIFGIPFAIALATTAGLITALLDDGVVDAVSWAALSVPVLTAVWSWRKRKR
ncbi:hypothetical protein Sp245p_25820 (plasmid) [Azospirillum baldaniorum]|uniref:Uncharacterized protein n=1 Tax=Azospirillum baldaniorum TaxID=1064539 RepID=A0A9P1JZX8_9PROT|nr:hypothetical protein [Azospirillum baldaniorum]TWA77938.1 hypothetical protein FBZ85_10698 [Azospirillum brasilense]AWJ93245.1 hypothetical protein Sp245p_25820 [Azospirillum baldaniorum]NUB05253.1 hypothetical protein [Azospirillum baldaniorum]TWA63493.1 hypothetical protein FBZ84_11016 [Azospirillum baldaniorum]CCD02964.1 hypothetical protein; putative signal peptide [Azospirillum baldaniorum]